MTWLLKIKRRAQNAMIAWLDFGVEPKHRRPSGDLLLDHSNNDDLEDWPGALADDLEHEAWLRSMTDPQTPEDYARAHEGAERLRAAMHEQALQQGDEFIHEATDGSSQK